MNIRILLAALESYAASAAYPAEDKPAITEAIKSCTDAIDHQLIDDSRVSIISDDKLADILLTDTYDIYNRLITNGSYKSADSEDLLYDYISECSQQPKTAMFTDQQLSIGFGAVSDLWLDNNQPVK